ncbi:acyl carrier protein [Chondromyces crocatus]|uniref:Acyl carrier protein n=1 Tax=Chondromyces crocatus TaxID=52 RepID=A0A0K1ESU5_CHOCO|nr:acyl carrier protein [Chondromyces crocatus]AKT43683.1 acyl carrier protein [Chondromyces crocatus]
MTWTRDNVRAELIEVLKGHAPGDVEVTDGSHLVGDLSIDSLGVMEVLADLEDKFKLTIPDDALREVETVGDVAKAIETRLQSDGRLAG